MFYKKSGRPEDGEIVLCTVTKVLYHSVFVTLDEYENLDGMIHISEIAPGRIRNIRDYVKEGKKIVCKTLEIKKNTGNIDLSLRRVTVSQRIQKNNEIKQEAKSEKLFRSVGEQLKISMEEMYKRLGYAAIQKYGSLANFFKETLDKGKSIVSDIYNQKGIAEELYKQVAEKMKPTEVAIKGVLAISSYNPNGLDEIKSALQKLIKNGLKVSYIGAPKYKIEAKASNFKDAEMVLKTKTDELIKNIIGLGGTASFVKDE